MQGDLVSETELPPLVEEATNFAFSHGLVMFASAEEGAKSARHAPIALLPSPFPARSFHAARSLAKDFNLLVHRCSQDAKWLAVALQRAGAADEFTRRLMQMHERVLTEGIRQPLTLGIFRSDYMLHTRAENDYVLQQVELNTISCAFPANATATSNMHRFVTQKLRPQRYPIHSVPENTSLASTVRALHHAWELYGNTDAVIVLVCQDCERNAIDQKKIEYMLYDKYHVRVLRRSLGDVSRLGKMSEDGRLSIDGHEVAVAYFRCAYTPRDFPSEAQWEARLLLERSRAIKCPTLAYQLVGTKKVQQVLAEPGQLERFLPDAPEAVQRLRSCFAGLYSLDDASADPVIAKALANPHNYVLKPQREGGGNNLYEQDLHKALSTMSLAERAAWILMDRIVPPTFDTLFLRDGQVLRVRAVSELGIYSVFIGRGDQVVLNEEGGHLLRSKNAAQDDGGVAAGVAVMDSPFLVQV